MTRTTALPVMPEGQMDPLEAVALLLHEWSHGSARTQNDTCKTCLLRATHLRKLLRG